MTPTAEMSECLAAYAAGLTPPRDVERAATKQVLAILKAAAPGRSVELRIPPYAAIQVVEGPNHRRGTPSAVVEMSARALLQLAVGELDWDSCLRNATVTASGERSNLSYLFPC
jgi:alpha-D-ribose 1-methylphosphonate 5-triphosphate synthase subunit PhnL